MPDMDGFKLLEHVGLEMDLPVIMMSADGRTSAVMKGIKHGACDYLMKPVRMEELRNIWQHVIRKKFNECKEVEQLGSVEDNDRHRRMTDDAEYASSGNDGNEGSWKSHKKRDAKEDEDDGELDNDDPSASKKPRVVWTVELHQQFVNAVNQLGMEKAVPKRILELMNVPGLTRENVASHLQENPQCFIWVDELCRAHGLEYYHVPVQKKVEKAAAVLRLTWILIFGCCSCLCIILMVFMIFFCLYSWPSNDGRSWIMKPTL